MLPETSPDEDTMPPPAPDESTEPKPTSPPAPVPSEDKGADVIDMPKQPHAPDPLVIVGDEFEQLKGALENEAQVARKLGEHRANFLLTEATIMNEVKAAVAERETIGKAIAKRKKIDLRAYGLDFGAMRFVPRKG